MVVKGLQVCFESLGWAGNQATHLMLKGNVVPLLKLWRKLEFLSPREREIGTSGACVALREVKPPFGKL